MNRTTLACLLAFMIPVLIAIILANRNSGTLELVNLPETVEQLFCGESIELISLSPRHQPNPPDHYFHGFEPLGSVVISDRRQLLAMARSLDQAVGKNEIEMARCFWPRHGIRGTCNGKTIELLVCFECAPLVVYVDDKRVFNAKVSAKPKALFDRPLKVAGIPINQPPF